MYKLEVRFLLFLESGLLIASIKKNPQLKPDLRKSETQSGTIRYIDIVKIFCAMSQFGSRITATPTELDPNSLLTSNRLPNNCQLTCQINIKTGAPNLTEFGATYTQAFNKPSTFTGIESGALNAY